MVLSRLIACAALVAVVACPVAGKDKKRDPFLDAALAVSKMEEKGMAALEKRDFDRAAAYFSILIKAHPKDPAGYFGRGVAYHNKNKQDQAIADFNEAIRIDPKATAYRLMRGASYEVKKEHRKALADYDEALRTDPEDPSAHHFLARLLATCPQDGIRDGKRAVRLATTACERTKWKDSWCLAALAAAKAEVGDYKEAVKLQKKAIEVGYNANKAGLKVAAQALACYERDKPYRDRD